MPTTAEPVYGTVTVDGNDHAVVLDGDTPGGESPSGLQYDSDRYNTAAELEVSILADTAPPKEATVSCTIQGEKIFAGTVTKSESRTGGYVHLIANDAVRALRKATLTQSFTQASLRQIAEAALSEAEVEYTLNLPTERTSAEYNNQRCDKILDDIADYARAVWIVDATNTVQLTQDVTEISAGHSLNQVIDASPGDRKQPYQSVRVEGSSPTSKRGRAATHLLSSSSVVATAGEGEPQHKRQDSRIKTQQMAERTAQAILDEFKRQQKTGTVKLIGDAAVRPFDTATLPSEIAEGRYLVSSVSHSITSEGFTTTIGAGGAVRA